KSLGWRAPGYHRLVDTDGTVHKLLQFDQVSNGVLGFNTETINICYIGGVENTGTAQKPGWNAKDTRSSEQTCGLEHCVHEALQWLRDNGNHSADIVIKGHRDFSPDKNGSGVIESWERIKECPSFDAIPEYSHLIFRP